MEVSGELHAPAALPPGKEPPVPVGYDAGWATEQVWTTWRREAIPSERSVDIVNSTRPHA
jgi:hypothetical protein